MVELSVGDGQALTTALRGWGQAVYSAAQEELNIFVTVLMEV